MKVFKKFLILALVFCMMASMLALTSCKKDDTDDTDGTNQGTNENNDNTPTAAPAYTITIVDGANAPVAGVKVMVDPTYKTYTSDENGKIAFDTDKTGLKVMILSSPDGYEHSSEPVSFKSGSKELKLTVSKVADDKVTYSVTVLDQNGDPVVGAGVQLCYNGVCLTPVNTNASGVAENSLKSGFEVSVLLTLPEEYSATPVSGDYHAVIPEGQTEITVTVTKN